MRLSSCRDLKSEIAAEIVATAPDAEARAFYGATEPPTPAGVGLGVAKRGDEYLLAVRSSDPVAAAAMSARAHGEADVRIITVTKRNEWQASRRPLEPGVQVGMKGKGFVGTLGCFVRDDRAIYALSNSHVLADEGTASPGHVIGQPFGGSPVAVLDRFIPFSRTAPNLVDAAIARIDRAQRCIVGWTAAINSGIQGVRDVTPDDLGREVFKVGRTTGIRKGRITAVEIDGLTVGYDAGAIRFNDQVEVSGGPSTTFSAPGDSGSLIVTGDGWGLALLFAGGPDATGEDFTFGNRLSVVLRTLGVRMA